MKENRNSNRNKAVALSYKEGYNAPKVVAKGSGEIADRIVEKGKENKIKVYRDDSLVEELMKLELNQEIPPNLYEAVSMIILFVYQMDKEKGELYEK